MSREWIESRMCAKGLVGYLVEKEKGLSEKHVLTVHSSINVELNGNVFEVLT